MSERIEKIMQEYQQMVMERTCLENQILNFKGITETEMIDSMYFSHPEGERVQTSGVSEKTATIAMTYRNKMERINLDWREHLEKKHSMLAEELIFFEAAVLSLSGIRYMNISNVEDSASISGVSAKLEGKTATQYYLGLNYKF